MATVWRWPPDRLDTRLPHGVDGAHRQRRQGLAGHGLHRGLVEHAPALELLAAEEHVLDDVEVVAQREVLVDDLDAERGTSFGLCTVDRLALEEVVAGVDRVDAGDRLDQRRLAGAVVTDQGGHLAGVDARSRRRGARGRRRSSC